MGKRANKAVGFFAFLSPNDVVCTDNGACVISGSKQAMEDYLSELGARGSETIKKTRFGEILQGLSLGAAYAFDEKSYKLFYPLAKAERLDVTSPDVFINIPQGDRFLTVKLGSN
jgi:hypothetical protein